MDRAPAALVGVAVALTAASGAFALSRAVATDDPAAPPPATVPAATTVPGVTTVAGVTTVPGAGSGATTTVLGGATSVAPAQVAIDIANFQFSPAEVTIPVGTTVVWTNSDSAQHSVLANDGTFSSAPLGPGATFSFTFSEPGTYDYICGFHTSMSATITVTG